MRGSKAKVIRGIAVGAFMDLRYNWFPSRKRKACLDRYPPQLRKILDRYDLKKHSPMRLYRWMKTAYKRGELTVQFRSSREGG